MDEHNDTRGAMDAVTRGNGQMAWVFRRLCSMQAEYRAKTGRNETPDHLRKAWLDQLWNEWQDAEVA